MSIQEIVASGGGALFIVLTLVQIAPVKINPWSRLAKVLGHAINSEVITKVDKLDNSIQQIAGQVDQLNAKREEDAAVNARTRILRFNDELLHDELHTKDHFDQILLDITFYEQYCVDHPKFRNGIAVAAIENINGIYKKCLSAHSFL